jgi:hypothetical protein
LDVRAGTAVDNTFQPSVYLEIGIVGVVFETVKFIAVGIGDNII